MNSSGRFLPICSPFLAALLLLTSSVPLQGQIPVKEQSYISLPTVTLDGSTSVEASIHERRSVRSFGDAPLALRELGQILWACQGVTWPMPAPPQGFTWEWRGGYRSAPSAGALYPLELYVVVGDVNGLEPGVYRYDPVFHHLLSHLDGDLREDLWNAALRQSSIRQAPASLILAGVVERTAVKYGERAERYVHMEVGAAAENVYLQVQVLGLGTVFMGAFDDEDVARVLSLAPGERAFGIMPVGHGSGTP
jgi:SagB-type dehydrogenase family enzyme